MSITKPRALTVESEGIPPTERSTVVSDAVLAAACGTSAAAIAAAGLRGGTPLCIGLALTMLAAILGCFRFGGGRRAIPVIPWHDVLSGVAADGTLPFLALGFSARGVPLGTIATIVATGICLFAALMSRGRTVYKHIAGAVSLGLIGWWTYVLGESVFATVTGATGILLYLLSGVVVGTEGTWRAIRRVDVFHYMLAAANACFAGVWLA